jgi:hypothetical protein
MGFLDDYLNRTGALAGTGGILQGLISAPIPFQVPTTGGFGPTDVSASNRHRAGVTVPEMSASGFGRQADDQNPLAALLSGIGGGLGSIGNGIGSLFSGGPSAAPAAAGPGAGQQQGVPPAPAAAGPGLLDRLSAGANSFAGVNPIAALLNGMNGLVTGQRSDPQGIMLQQQAATARAFHRALVANGVAPEQAVGLAHAAALNPEIAKTLARQLYSNLRLGSSRTRFANDRADFANPDTRTATEPGQVAPNRPLFPPTAMPSPAQQAAPTPVAPQAQPAPAGHAPGPSPFSFLSFLTPQVPDLPLHAIDRQKSYGG